MEVTAYIKEDNTYKTLYNIQDDYAPHIERWIESILPYPLGQPPYELTLEDIEELNSLLNSLLSNKEEDELKWAVRANLWLGKAEKFNRHEYWNSLDIWLVETYTLIEKVKIQEAKGEEIAIDFYPEES